MNHIRKPLTKLEKLDCTRVDCNLPAKYTDWGREYEERKKEGTRESIKGINTSVSIRE